MARGRLNKNASIERNAGSKRSRSVLDLSNKFADDEQIASDDELESDDEAGSFKDENQESEDENIDVKKVRLAREYLQKLEEGSASSSSSDSEEEPLTQSDVVSQRLQRERLSKDGTLEKPFADKLEKIIAKRLDFVISHHQRPALSMLPPQIAAAAWVEAGVIGLLKGHDLSPTSVSLQKSGEKMISGSKDHSVLLWNVENETRIATISPHWKKRESDSNVQNQKSFRNGGQVLAVDCSDDGRFAVVGRRDSTISVFDIRMKNGKDVNLVKTFQVHKGAVTCLKFRSQSNQLFSGGDDRCIRHYNLDEMLCMETLYGHQLGVTSIDCYRKERPVSVSQDRTARIWKLQEDTHLIFRGGAKSQPSDCVSILKDDWFVTGHQDGDLSLWMTEKKKPVAAVNEAHGKDGILGRGIVSLDCLKGSDVVASGSSDGYLRFWKVSTGTSAGDRGLQALSQVPLHGYLNAISFGPKGRICAVAVGQEHRLGRWNRVQNSLNRIAIVKLQNDDS